MNQTVLHITMLAFILVPSILIVCFSVKSYKKSRNNYKILCYDHAKFLKKGEVALLDRAKCTVCKEKTYA